MSPVSHSTASCTTGPTVINSIYSSMDARAFISSSSKEFTSTLGFPPVCLLRDKSSNKLRRPSRMSKNGSSGDVMVTKLGRSRIWKMGREGKEIGKEGSLAWETMRDSYPLKKWWYMDRTVTAWIQ
ncbi:hypothetical protein IEQ34_013279 [Dendrobium chrysotoxum]|uniref:Uncharacterized protein n=1 Tax=Dendrobium chrysotoxum TaxID=161865 RepID=A0AAV7G7Z8_DENCH|nr:hypothetical protein IEQ34_013279 [Dendrobium chrysotoxum]